MVVAQPSRIRPVALAAIRRHDDLLVFEGHDATRDQTFYRPLGGGIEFGEPAAEALRRELREELEDGGMKWTRAVHHLESLAQMCADMADRPRSIVPLRVTQLWVAGDLLGPPRDVEVVTVALCVDLPVDEVAWWSEPPGAQQWAHATRLAKNPVLPWWRSAHAPVWNHRIDRPAPVWDDALGVRADTLAALRDGSAESVRLPAPAADQLRARLHDELAISLDALRAGTRAYDDRRWRPGKLEPVADALWRASDGYLDVLDALQQRSVV